MKKYKVLLVGCGQLGTRHLQAVASLPNIAEVHVVDSSEGSLSLGQARLKEVANINADIEFRWLKKIEQSSAGGDLCIVATRAKGRCALVKQIGAELGYKTFLIEKMVSQSVQEYEDLLSFCNKNDVAVWVNCKSRTYGIHKYIKERLNPNEPFIYSRISGNHGLACNGIHGADLFVFYDDAESITKVGSKIDPILHASKRGAGVYDLSGTLHGCSAKGSEVILSYAANHKGPNHISIVSPSGRFFVDQGQQLAFESYPDLGWKWKPISFKENWLVSHMTKKFTTDILTSRTCELPTLLECLPAHKFILDTLLPYFKQLSNKEVDWCPVT